MDPPPTPAPQRSRTGPLWVAAILTAAASAIAVGRSSGMPTAEWLESYASTVALDPVVAEYAEEVLVVPFGALIAVFVRLSLGIPMLGPFRPVLIAMAFEFTGVWVGIGFVAMVFLVIGKLRPRLKTSWLPYTSRLSIMLITVVFLQVAFLFLASAQGWTNAIRAAFFPIIVLCLAADGYARVLSESGLREAVWRGVTTILTAVLISAAYEIPGVSATLIGYPELMLVQIAAIVVVSRYVAFRWLEGWNPMRRRRRRVVGE